jgi:uncharacterized protein YbdZ (MbtH family)
LIQRFLNWLAEGLYRRGQGLAHVADQSMRERRDAVRAARDGVAEAMMFAERDREHGVLDDQNAAVAAASRASALSREIEDDQAREQVAAWKQQFDAIPKGWKEREEYSRRPPGYPDDEWADLRGSAESAQERLGEVLRGLL